MCPALAPAKLFFLTAIPAAVRTHLWTIVAKAVPATGCK